jgi:N-acetylmuramoyl-L-alanine amidase
MDTGLPLRPGAQGEAVRDLQRRLAGVDIDLSNGLGDDYDEATAEAVRRFQKRRGIEVDGICGRETWSALVEAGYRLGDRLLYLRSPMLRGDDVAELQRRLGALGFDVRWLDGIFGPDTERALEDFQRNSALTVDGVAGRDTLAALQRLRAPEADTASVMGVKERETLRGAPRQLSGRRIVVGQAGGLDALLAGLGRHLRDRGAAVVVLDHPDPSVQALEANRFGAEVYLVIDLTPEPTCRAAYFAVEGFESAGGRRLAELIAASLPHVLGATGGSSEGMRLPILRETRMPAVACRLGPSAAVVGQSTAVADALVSCLERWCRSPLGE